MANAGRAGDPVDSFRWAMGRRYICAETKIPAGDKGGRGTWQIKEKPIIERASMKDYSNLTDEEILNLISSGDNEAMDYLFSRYKPLVEKKSRSYFINGGSREDLTQEGMIGLFKAIRDFQAQKNIAFFPFAELCKAISDWNHCIPISHRTYPVQCCRLPTRKLLKDHT